MEMNIWLLFTKKISMQKMVVFMMNVYNNVSYLHVHINRQSSFWSCVILIRSILHTLSFSAHKSISSLYLRDHALKHFGSDSLIRISHWNAIWKEFVPFLLTACR
jgi:hypothetical protein